LPEAIEPEVSYSDEGKRFYKTPEGNIYPSVTTVLSTLSADGIEKWRKKVGAEEAKKIGVQASRRGTAVHLIAENYLLNKDDYTSGAMPANVSTFNQIKGYLDLYCDAVHGNEYPLYSDELRTAGRCDMIGRMHGIRTIGDFKTAKKFKKEEWIKGYFLQCTTYALALYERHKIWCPQICIMIATDEDGLQPFLKRTKDYVDEVRDVFDNYHKQREVQCLDSFL
jgi:genome maintenance exonuclease 1